MLIKSPSSAFPVPREARNRDTSRTSIGWQQRRPSGTVAPGIYITLNPVTNALLSRAKNRVKDYARQTTSDRDILERRWLPIDFDPVRPSGIGATDAEHDAALERARACHAWLTEHGWPPGLLADSGNGGHLLYPVDMPNDTPTRDLFERCLHALALWFSDDCVAVDTTTFNAARIWKVYGTTACKGDPTDDRPHRDARLLEVPNVEGIVGRDQLEALAAILPKSQAAKRRSNGNGSGDFDLSRWITDHSLPVSQQMPWHGGTKFILNPCPWNADHTNRSAYIVQLQSGAIAAGCHHNGCAGNDWAALRRQVGDERAVMPPPISAAAKADARRVAPPTNPMAVARALVTEAYSRPDGLVLRDHRGNFYHWGGRCWPEIDLRDVRGTAYRWLEHATYVHPEKGELPFAPSRRKIDDPIDALRAVVLLDSKLEAPSWTDDRAEPKPTEVVSMRNGLLHVRTRALLPHSPTFFSPHSLPFDYLPAAAPPARWLTFLRDLWPEDPSSISVLQEVLGYVLGGDTRLQKIFLFVGPKRAGKGTIARVLTGLLGPHHVAAPRWPACRRTSASRH